MWLYSGKSGCIQAKWFLSGKNVLFGQSGRNRAKLVVVGQRWLYSSKSGCIRAKMVVFGQKQLYSGNVVVFGQKWLYSS